MKLTDLEPRWASDHYSVVDGVLVFFPERHGMGITFLCPCCREQRIGVFFANPVDGLPVGADHRDGGAPRKLWQREGDTFESLTLSPSIDASSSGHWHGHIRNGEVR